MNKKNHERLIINVVISTTIICLAVFAGVFVSKITNTQKTDILPINLTTSTVAHKSIPPTKIKIISSWTTIDNAADLQVEAVTINGYCAFFAKNEDNNQALSITVAPYQNYGTTETVCSHNN